MPDWLEKALSEPTTSIEIAGKALGISRKSAYEAAHRGDIPALQIGRSLRVPTSWLRKVLGL